MWLDDYYWVEYDCCKQQESYGGIRIFSCDWCADRRVCHGAYKWETTMSEKIISKPLGPAGQECWDRCFSKAIVCEECKCALFTLESDSKEDVSVPCPKCGHTTIIKMGA